MAQFTQRDLDVAHAQFDTVVVIAVFALLPHLDRAPLLARPADADAFGVEAAVAKRRCATGADPFTAALVPSCLLRKPFVQCFHQFFPAAERLYCGFFLVGEIAVEELAQPFLGQFGIDLFEIHDTAEILAKHPIELVELRFVLDQRHARHVVKVIDRTPHDARFEGFHQGQEFLDRHLQAGVFQREKKFDQHWRLCQFCCTPGRDRMRAPQGILPAEFSAIPTRANSA